MDVTYYADPFPHVIIKNTHDEETVKMIMDELDHLQLSRDPEKNGSGKYKDGSFKKSNAGAWLDDLVLKKDRHLSHILRSNQFMKDPKIMEACMNSITLSVISTDFDSTLISYYENADKYDAHWDRALVTILTHFHKEPKSWSGGELTFTHYPDFVYEAVNNQTLIFPSAVWHQVEPVVMNDNSPIGEGYGRWTISNFTAWKNGAQNEELCGDGYNDFS
jgi:Rps23 Pro-64 3,4-dihydroxylase Tpa1-like proline 4-hydroxylase